MSGRKNVLRPYKVASAQSLASSFQTASTNVEFYDRFAISVNVTSGTAVGTFTLQGRTSLSASSPVQGSANVGASNEWATLAGTSQSAPANGDSITWDCMGTGLTEIRVAYTSTSGTGTCDIWIAAKES